MCNCISEVEAKLKETGRNTKLDIPVTFSLTGKLSADRVNVATCKRDDKKREKPLRLFAAFCPFCGEAYPEKEAAEQSVHPTYGELPAPEVWTTPDGLSAPVVRLDPPISG